MYIKSIILLLLIKNMNERNKNISFVNGIYRGDNRIENDFKYQVFVRKLMAEIFYVCGGTVIDEYHIITAAHCVDGTDKRRISVFAGSTNLKVGGNVYRVERIHIHENYKPRFLPTSIQRALRIPSHPENDIAVLTLADILPIGRNIEKVELPIIDVSPCTETSICKIAGWGDPNGKNISISDKLLWTLMEILSPIMCHIRQVPLRNNEICAADPLRIAAGVKGDSGGGLICNGILIGVLSAGKFLSSRPNVFVNVYDFKSFINSILKANITYQQLNEENEEPEIKKPRIL